MTNLPEVIVLAGGLSHERDVSLKSGRRAAQALRQVGHEVVEADLGAGLIDLLRAHPDAVVLPLIHGAVGEDGALREVFGLLKVPFVGSVASACRIAFTKSVATPVVKAYGVRTPDQVALPHDVFGELGANELVKAVAQTIGLPAMVKPARSGSALGCAKVEAVEELPAAMVGAYAYDSLAVVERFIDGTEVTVAIFDLDGVATVLPAVEIRPDSGVYDYAARYTAGTTRFVTPAEIDDRTAAACSELALGAYRALGLRDFARIDIMIDRASGEPYFLEANVAPGMTETSAVPLAMSAAGLDLGAVLSDLVRVAAERAR